MKSATENYDMGRYIQVHTVSVHDVELSIAARLFLETSGQPKTLSMACPEEFMIPEYQEDHCEIFTLSLEEVEVRLIVFQTPNVSGKNQVWSLYRNFEVRILVPNFKMKIRYNLEPGSGPEVAIE